MSEAEMVACLTMFDVALGCRHCSEAWWAENYTRFVEDFHAADCPLKGRRDIIEKWGGLNFAACDPDDHRKPAKVVTP